MPQPRIKPRHARYKNQVTRQRNNYPREVWAASRVTTIKPEDVKDMNDKINTARHAIWNRAKATANPKGYIIRTKFIKDAKIGSDAYCYNIALGKAKKWANA